MAFIGTTSTTKADVGLSNVDNDSTATIRSGVTKSDVGLGSVDNDSTATIRSLLTGSIAGRSSGQNAQINNANGNYHKRISIGGVYQSSGSTTHFMRYGRHWWGVGNFHIHLFENLYGPNSDYGHFLINGHTRNGNPSIATIYNQGVPTPYPTGYNGSAERCEIKFDSSSYYTYNILIEAWNSTYGTTDSIGVGQTHGANSWHMYNSTEII